MTLSLGVPIEMVPRRYLQWINKPQRNRITADFAGLHSQVTCIVRELLRGIVPHCCSELNEPLVRRSFRLTAPRLPSGSSPLRCT